MPPHIDLNHLMIRWFHIDVNLYCFVCFRGVWNVPFISSIYLIQKDVLNKMKGAFGPGSLDPDMTMCGNLREQVSKHNK